MQQKGFIPIALVVLIATVLGGAVAAQSSKGSLPGEPLYRVKELTEQVRLASARRPEEKARVYLSIAEEKLAEVEKLEGKGAAAEVIAGLLEKVKLNQQKAIELLGNVVDAAQKQESLEKLKDNSKKQDRIVKKVLERVPEDKKETIEKVSEETKKEADKAITNPPSPTQPSEGANNSTPTPTSVVSPAAPTPTRAILPTPTSALKPTATPTLKPTNTPTPTATPTPTPAQKNLSISSISPDYVNWAGNTSSSFEVWGSGFLNNSSEGWKRRIAFRDRSPFVKYIDQGRTSQWTDSYINTGTIYSWDLPVTGIYVDVYVEIYKDSYSGSEPSSLSSNTYQVRFNTGR